MERPPHSLFAIAGKIALVTGSSRGIGFALAQGLLEAGVSVVLNGRSRDTLEAARSRLVAIDGRYKPMISQAKFDVTDSAQVRNEIRNIEANVGPIDILVNNAGIQRRAPFLNFSESDWDELVATNLTSAFLVSRQVGRFMAQRGRGKIINVASVQSAASRPGIAPYAATKGGLKMLTRGMCVDLAGFGIQVNALAPGYFATDLNTALVDDPTFSAWLTERTPAGRWGRVEELVGTLLFLSAPASDFVNGQTIYVDGGVLAAL